MVTKTLETTSSITAARLVPLDSIDRTGQRRIKMAVISSGTAIKLIEESGVRVKQL